LPMPSTRAASALRVGEVVRQVSQQLANSFGLTESVPKTLAANR
jgi:hypothetical protein